MTRAEFSAEFEFLHDNCTQERTDNPIRRFNNQLAAWWPSFEGFPLESFQRGIGGYLEGEGVRYFPSIGEIKAIIQDTGAKGFEVQPQEGVLSPEDWEKWWNENIQCKIQDFARMPK